MEPKTCNIQLHNTWLKLEDAVEKLKIDRRLLHLDETGSLVVGQRKDVGQIPERLVNLICFTGTCWWWKGSLTRKGYGMVSVRGKDIPVHRLIYMLVVGSIKPGLLICHSCDNRCCVNPHYMFQGTDLDNCRDKIVKGRLVNERGIERYNAKLDDDKVRYIRSIYKGVHGQLTQLGNQFNVSRHVIRSVVYRERWKHVI